MFFLFKCLLREIDYVVGSDLGMVRLWNQIIE